MSGTRRYTGALAVTGILMGGTAIAASLAIFGSDALGWQMAARYSARAAFVLFLIVYLTRPAAQIFPVFGTLKRERRGLGLAFAGAHFLHLGALLTFLILSGERPSSVTLTLGGFAFVVVAAMAATSNDAAARQLGVNWRRLHTFGLHYVWFIFVATYAGRVARSPDMPEYVILLGLGLAALITRVSVPLIRRRTVEEAK